MPVITAVASAAIILPRHPVTAHDNKPNLFALDGSIILNTWALLFAISLFLTHTVMCEIVNQNRIDHHDIKEL